MNFLKYIHPEWNDRSINQHHTISKHTYRRPTITRICTTAFIHHIQAKHTVYLKVKQHSCLVCNYKLTGTCNILNVFPLNQNLQLCVYNLVVLVNQQNVCSVLFLLTLQCRVVLMMRSILLFRIDFVVTYKRIESRTRKYFC